MRRFMQVVLVINIAIVGLLDMGGYVFHVGPVGAAAAAEPIISRQYAAVALGYAVVLAFFVLRRFQREPGWLLVPPMFLIPLWVDALYELSAGSGPTADYLPPAIIRAVLVACFVAGYINLRRPAQDRAAVAAREGTKEAATASR